MYGVVAFFYRSDLFGNPEERTAFKKEYGYELKPPETYDQFRDVAKFFTRKKGSTLAGKVLESDFYGTVHSGKPTFFLWNKYISYMKAWGGRVYDPKTMMPEWNSPKNLAAAEFVRSIASYMPPNWLAMSSGESAALFVEGRAATTIEFQDRMFPMATDKEKSKIIDKWDYLPLPSVSGSAIKHATLLNVNLMGIYALSKNKEAAYKLLERVSLTDMQKRKLADYFSPPTRKSVLADAQFAGTLPAWLKKSTAFGAGDVSLFTYDRIPQYMQVVDLAGLSLAEAFAGQKTVKQALDEGQAKLVKLFKEVGYLK
jgi:multiple sugar transport system substrate-binding protein